MSRYRLRLPKQPLWIFVPLAVLLPMLLPVLLLALPQPRPIPGLPRVIDVTAAIPELGGFQPASIKVAAGEQVLLRFHAQNGAHSVAIGPGLGIDLGYIAPNTIKSVELTFAEAGTFTFYCNLWCSPNHWRMRGVIEVVDRDAAPGTARTVARDAVIDALVAAGVDIDAASQTNAHSLGLAAAPAGQDVLQPFAARGTQLLATTAVPAELQDLAWRRTHTPGAGLTALAAANPTANRADLADLTAFLWISGATAADPQLLQAADLYTKNCAACHGDKGGGDGLAATLGPQPPAAFADAARMFDRRPDVLYAKIRRGGMGTGMPNFGTIFTPDETWSLVDHLWRLAFGNPAVKH